MGDNGGEYTARMTAEGVFGKRHLVKYKVLPTFVPEGEPLEFRLTCNTRKVVGEDDVTEVDELPEGTCQRCEEGIEAAFLKAQDAL